MGRAVCGGVLGCPVVAQRLIYLGGGFGRDEVDAGAGEGGCEFACGLQYRAVFCDVNGGAGELRQVGCVAEEHDGELLVVVGGQGAGDLQCAGVGSVRDDEGGALDRRASCRLECSGGVRRESDPGWFGGVLLDPEQCAGEFGSGDEPVRRDARQGTEGESGSGGVGARAGVHGEGVQPRVEHRLVLTRRRGAEDEVSRGRFEQRRRCWVVFEFGVPLPGVREHGAVKQDTEAADRGGDRVAAAGAACEEAKTGGGCGDGAEQGDADER